jgi:hypothetical protein
MFFGATVMLQAAQCYAHLQPTIAAATAAFNELNKREESKIK